MLSRALSLAAASLVGCLVATAGWAQNLDAGKSPAQIFNGNCTACHKSARALLRTVAPSSLPGFLRQHYTTGSDMAQMLSGFLLANGAGSAEARGSTRNSRLEAGPNLRANAPIGIASPEADQGTEQTQRRGRTPPQTAATRPDADGLEGRRAHRGRSDRLEGAEPPTEAKLSSDQIGAKSKLAKKNRKGGPPAVEPSELPPAVEPGPELAARPELKPAKAEPASEQAIDAAVPVPEPVNLPPPTAADIKLDVSPVDAPKPVTEASKMPAHPAVSAIVPSPSGPPAPPISQ